MKKKLKKVDECYNNAEVYQCPRCNQDYCDNCHEKQEVDFDIINSSDDNPKAKIEWKGLMVCPYCYNQLIDLKLKISCTK